MHHQPSIHLCQLYQAHFIHNTHRGQDFCPFLVGTAGPSEMMPSLSDTEKRNTPNYLSSQFSVFPSGRICYLILNANLGMSLSLGKYVGLFKRHAFAVFGHGHRSAQLKLHTNNCANRLSLRKGLKFLLIIVVPQMILNIILTDCFHS